jgi:hypothetical protein
MLIFGLEAFFNLADNSSGALNFDIPFWQVALSGVFEFAGNIIYGLLIGLAQLAWYGNRQDAVTGIGLKLELDYAQKEESLHQNEEGEY